MNSETLSLKTIINELDFLKKKAIIQWNKRLTVTWSQINKKTRDLWNAKEHDLSFIRRENTKSVTQSEKTTYQPKSFEKPNIDDIKKVIAEHLNCWYKPSKTKRQAEKVGYNRSLCCRTSKSKNSLNEKKNLK